MGSKIGPGCMAVFRPHVKFALLNKYTTGFVSAAVFRKLLIFFWSKIDWKEFFPNWGVLGVVCVVLLSWWPFWSHQTCHQTQNFIIENEAHKQDRDFMGFNETLPPHWQVPFCNRFWNICHCDKILLSFTFLFENLKCYRKKLS